MAARGRGSGPEARVRAPEGPEIRAPEGPDIPEGPEIRAPGGAGPRGLLPFLPFPLFPRSFCFFFILFYVSGFQPHVEVGSLSEGARLLTFSRA